MTNPQHLQRVANLVERYQLKTQLAPGYGARWDLVADDIRKEKLIPGPELLRALAEEAAARVADEEDDLAFLKGLVGRLP